MRHHLVWLPESLYLGQQQHLFGSPCSRISISRVRASFSACSHEESQTQQKRPISSFQQSLAVRGFLHAWSLAQQICQPNKCLFSHVESLAEGWCRQPNASLQINCVISFCFSLYLMLHACTARFDVTGISKKKFNVFGWTKQGKPAILVSFHLLLSSMPRSMAPRYRLCQHHLGCHALDGCLDTSESRSVALRRVISKPRVLAPTGQKWVYVFQGVKCIFFKMD